MPAFIHTDVWPQCLIAVGLASAAAACGAGTEPSPAGSVEVTVTVSGRGADPDGFTIVVDGREREFLPAAGRVVITGLTPGPHTVELGGLASTCALSGGTLQTVDVPSGASASVAFAVSCSDPTGILRIVTHTTGTQPDPDGYRVRVDGGGEQAVGIEDTVDLAGLAAGDHLVELRGTAANCAVTGMATRHVNVAPTDTTIATFALICEAQKPGEASIIVSVSSQIINYPAPLTYTVVLDDVLSLPVPSSGTVTFQTAAGAHAVFLKVPGFCSVGGFTPQPNPVSVSVVANEIRTVRFGVLCIG